MQTEALLSQFVAQAPAAVAMFDVDMRYLASSLRWRQDYHLRDDLVGRSHYEVFPEIGDAWKQMHQRALAGETLRAQRDAFVRADGSVRWQRWEIQPWRRSNGEVGGVIVFTEDVTAYENEREKTRQSEAALRALGDNLPDATIFSYTRDADGTARFPYISAGLEKLTGVSVEAALADANLLFSQLLPEYGLQMFAIETASRRDLTDFALDAPIRRADGELRWIRLRARPDRQPDGQIIWNGVQFDITEEKRQEETRRVAERRKSYLLEMADALKPLSDPVEMIAVASERLGRELGAHQVVYAEIDGDEEFATIRREWSEGSMRTSVGAHRLADFGPDLIANLRLGKVFALDDVAADPRTGSAAARAMYRAREIGAFLRVPLVKGGKLVAVLSVHHRQPRRWSALEISLTEETAERTWGAIERARAEAALRESEERLRVALTAADAGAWEWDLATNANVWSDQLWRLYGLDPHCCEPSFDAWRQTIHPDDRVAIARAVAEAVTAGRELCIEWRIRAPDGTLRWLMSRGGPIASADPAKPRYIGVVFDITAEKRQEEARREIELRKAYLLDLDDALKPLSDPAEMIGVASERLGQRLGAHRVLYAEIDDSGELATMRREWCDGLMASNAIAFKLSDYDAALVARLRQGQVNAIDDIDTDPRAGAESARSRYRERGIRAYLNVPQVKDGRLSALLSVQSRHPRRWSDLDIALAEETAERTWAAIERERAQEALRASEERLRYALTAAAAGAWEWDVETTSTTWSEGLWELNGLERQEAPLPYDVWRRTIHPDDLAATERGVAEAFASGRDLMVEWRTPVADGAERWMMARGQPVRLPDQPIRRYIGAVFDITERKKSEEQIGHLAHHDLLTGLSNRLAFNDLLTAAAARADTTRTDVAVICIDLDRFKEVNDVFGHVVGDKLLRQMSQRLREAAQGAAVARVGGDEFTMIVTGLSARQRAAEIAARLRSAVATPFDIDGRLMRVGLSLGVALYPEHGDLESVLASADAALYRAKAEGRGKVCFFDSSLDNRLRERHALLQNLETALANDELLLHYQPQAGADEAIFGFEALIRWRHPRRGLVPPNVFIPIAEESGLITDIGEWVLREACREAASWPVPLNIAVNLSPVQFLKDGLPGLVHAILMETGLPGSRLELEITEGVLVSDFSRVSAILRQLKTLGVKVAMDDFGTGYSSLSYVQSFPFDKIKIDRSFVSSLHEDASSQAIVRAIIGLGQGLRVPLIAEGVETEEQLQFLRSAGCDEAQGYLIGAPKPIDAYAALVGRAEDISPARASA